MHIKKLLVTIAAGVITASALGVPGTAAPAAAVVADQGRAGPAPDAHDHSSADLDRCRRGAEFTPDRRLGDRVCAMGDGQFKLRTPYGDRIAHLDAPTAADRGTRDSLTVAAKEPAALAARAHHCATDSYRIQLVYMIPAGGRDASATMVPLMRQHFLESNAMVSNRAAEYGGDLSLRVVCDNTGQPAVRVVRSSTNDGNIGAIDQEIARQGLRATGQDNVVYWGDGGCGGGVAFGSGDARPGVENSVNNAPGVAVVTGRCPFTYMLHEQGHSMGAVLPGTPNGSGAGHCNDDADVMCYKDGGPRSDGYRSNVCPSPNGNLDYYWDCNVNDYFHPNPPAGSYLATNWNLASCSNRMIYRPACGTASLPRNAGR
ncbi:MULTISPECIES: hypothetical protein [Catenuloplanes]|uniref:Uncharacterized protein n=1 Tax=Catenuloplanes niger TaxID=587534 RepID=A0AAE3ZJL5_9ACTN|nr:hypothetical protein [Catenuloplanes niger]MDR7319865.1 hypothetical protein [Catenuloplanes niger]